MTKSRKMEEFLNEVTKSAFGRERDGKQCVTCGSPKIGPEDFRDAISLREFGISYMCQVCQDAAFSSDDGTQSNGDFDA